MTELTDEQCDAIRKLILTQAGNGSWNEFDHALIRAGAAAMLGREPVALTFTLAEADALLAFFSGEPGEVTVCELPAGVVPDDPQDPVGDGPSPAGLYAYMTEYPEEGSWYLGPADDPESFPRRPPAAQVALKPLGYVSERTIENLASVTPLPAGESEAIWHRANPPSRAAHPVYLAAPVVEPIVTFVCDECGRTAAPCGHIQAAYKHQIKGNYT